MRSCSDFLLHEDSSEIAGRDTPLRSAAIRENARKKRVHRHRKGLLVHKCKCWQCFRLRAAACSSVSDAIRCDGTKMLTYAVAVVAQCGCRSTQTIQARLKYRRRRGADAGRAETLMHFCCGWCLATILAFIGRHYDMETPLHPIGAIFDPFFTPEIRLFL